MAPGWTVRCSMRMPGGAAPSTRRPGPVGCGVRGVPPAATIQLNTSAIGPHGPPIPLRPCRRHVISLTHGRFGHRRRRRSLRAPVAHHPQCPPGTSNAPHGHRPHRYRPNAPRRIACAGHERCGSPAAAPRGGAPVRRRCERDPTSDDDRDDGGPAGDEPPSQEGAHAREGRPPRRWDTWSGTRSCRIANLRAGATPQPHQMWRSGGDGAAAQRVIRNSRRCTPKTTVMGH